MLRLATNQLKRFINVYDGISPALLATMSLASNISGNTQQELATSLLKAQLIPSQPQLNAWQAIDRKHFTKANNPYQNRPSRISKGQNMTDVFTHAVIVNHLADSLNQNVSVLDVGTGHGYLALLISKILKNKQIQKYQITGIDINQESIAQCKEIQTKHYQQLKPITFECYDLKQYLNINKQKKFNVIIGGYFMDEPTTQILTDKLETNGIGIWPTISQQGQALYKIQSNKHKTYIIQTMFSMPVVRSSVQKYFINADQDIEEEKTTQNYADNGQNNPQKLQQRRKEIQQKLKAQLKQLLQKYRKPNGKLLTLQEMRDNKQVKAKMDELQSLPRKKLKQALK